MGLLDERVQHDNALADQKAIERAADARPTARPKFEQPVAERARMRKAKTWPVFDQQFNETHIVGKNIDRPRFDLCKDALVEILELNAMRAC